MFHIMHVILIIAWPFFSFFCKVLQLINYQFYNPHLLPYNHL